MKQKGFDLCEQKNHETIKQKAYTKGFDSCYEIHSRKKENDPEEEEEEES